LLDLGLEALLESHKVLTDVLDEGTEVGGRRVFSVANGGIEKQHVDASIGGSQFLVAFYELRPSGMSYGRDHSVTRVSSTQCKSYC
jgi:hypothetical protein